MQPSTTGNDPAVLGSGDSKKQTADWIRRHAPGWIKAAIYAGLAYVTLFVDTAPCHGATCIEWQFSVQCVNGQVLTCNTTQPNCGTCGLTTPGSCVGGYYWTRCDCYAWWDPPDTLTVNATENCAVGGGGGWCRSGASVTLTGTDTAGHNVSFDVTVGGVSRTCGNPCTMTFPEGEGAYSWTGMCGGIPPKTQTGGGAYKVDSIAPIVISSVSGGTPGSGGWYRAGTVTISCSASDNAGGSGLSRISYPNPQAGGDGKYLLTCVVSDVAGNTAEGSAGVNIDGTPPVVTGTVSGGSLGGGGWYLGGPVNLGCTATDATSGVAGISYIRMTATDPGTTTLSCTAADYAGNSASYSTSVSIDNIAPSGKFLYAGNYCGGGWYNSPVLASLRAGDADSGPAGSFFSVDGASWSPAQKIGDGVHALSGTVTDVAGNSAAVEDSLQVDSAPPASVWVTKEGDWIGGTAVLEGKSLDIWSGIAAVEISLDGGATWLEVGKQPRWSHEWNTVDPDRPVPDGPAPLLVRAKDNACNPEQPVRVTVNVDNTSPDLSLRESLILMGNSTTFSARDSGSGLASVKLTISGNGIVPRSVDFPPSEGSMEFDWDGRDGNLDVAPFGVYEVLVEAWDKVGNHSSAQGSWVRPFPKSPPDVVTPVNNPIGGDPGTTGADSPPAKPVASAGPSMLLPFWSLVLPLGALGAWLTASNVALSRDRRWSELCGIRDAVARYRDQRQTYCQEEGEDD
jgi:hypothetical protein